MIKIITRILLSLSIVIPANLYAISVTDDEGLSVTLDRPAGRIVSLAPYTTELLFAAGAGNKIVGAVRYSYYPEAAKKIPRVGDTNKLDLERIISLEPDLIIAWQSNAAADTEILRKMHIPIFVSEPPSLEAIADTIINLGKLAGSEVTARRAGKSFLDKLTALKNKYSSKKPVVTTFYQFWNDPIYTINGDHVISDVIQLCGGRNVFADMPILSAQVSLEAVIGTNPDAIVASGIDTTRPAWLNDWNKWPELAAVKNHHIYYIPPDLIQRQTPRILEGASMMCNYLDEVRNKKATSH